MKKYIINMLVAIAFVTTAQAQVPVITTQPQSVTVCKGSKATFSIAATNNPTSVVWEFSLNDGETWSDISTANWASSEKFLTYVEVEPLSGSTVLGHKTSSVLIHAIAINANGNSLPSNAAQLIINTATDSLFISKLNSTATCVGNSFQLVGSQANGVSSSSNSSIATVNCKGQVSVKAQGNANINYVYTSTNGCTDTATYALNTSNPTAATVSGSTSLCVGTNTTFTANVINGTWSSNGRLNIDSRTGFSTATSAGTTAINYTLTGNNGCTTKTVFATTINSLPAMPTIAYASGTISPQTTSSSGQIRLCQNKTFTLVGSPSGGTWSSTGALSINPITGITNTTNTLGVGTVSYTVSNGSCSNKRTMSGSVVSCNKGTVNNQVLEETKILSIFPNPAKNMINVKLNSLTDIKELIVTDVYGKIVYKSPIKELTTQVNIESLANGVYFIGVITSSKTMTQKVIVE